MAPRGIRGHPRGSSERREAAVTLRATRAGSTDFMDRDSTASESRSHESVGSLTGLKRPLPLPCADALGLLTPCARAVHKSACRSTARVKAPRVTATPRWSDESGGRRSRAKPGAGNDPRPLQASASAGQTPSIQGWGRSLPGLCCIQVSPGDGGFRETGPALYLSTYRTDPAMPAGNGRPNWCNRLALPRLLPTHYTLPVN